MPKNKKPAGGRAAKNFEPRYGAKTSFQDRKRRPGAEGPAKPGSKSPNHRGYRPETEAAPDKRRWSASDRAGRDEARGIRQSARDDRSPRSFDRDERPRRSFEDRPARSFDRSDRPARSFDRDERPRRDAGERLARSFDRSDRPARSFDDRPRRSFEDRPARSFDRNDRPARSFDRDERPRRDAGERPARSFDRSDRPARSFDRDERPARSFDRDERPRRDSGERPARSFDRNERPARSFDRSDRPARSFDRSERPARSFDRDERPRRDAGERPARSFDRNDRPARSFDDRPRRDDRPARSFEDRPARSFDRTDRPARSFDDRPRRADGPSRSDWNAGPKRSAEHEQRVDVVHERLQAEAVDAATVTGAGFAELGLGDNIVRALAGLGADKPFPIQAATVAPILEGRDVLARGRTGSGKTIAFGAPLVESILRSQAGKRREFGRAPKALIMAPTRELALQIDRTVQVLARSVGLFTTQVYGGVPQARQVGALKKGVDIVIGTPGRIEDLLNQGKLDLSDVQIAVLDEADHMCELGFLEPVQRILRATAKGSQKLLFSATLDREVAALVDEFLVEPAVYEVAGEDQDSSTIEHRVLVIEHRDKAQILDSLVDREGKTLVFARTRAYAEMLAEQFDDAGIAAVALHGDLNQQKRTRNLEKLTSGRVNVLVATDVAARGIHVDDIDLVIQADAPDEYKTYLHRSGRTGRAGRSGTVVTLITRQRQRRMTELLDRAEIEAPFEPTQLGDDVLEEISGRQLADVTS
ncbi:Superfamily II DNA and RNA helicase [Microbacterium sp. ru370.1]|uniref:DEAD/DEAH box helicase n=1 Tax=unclassified Microbacterium TaxID=2609290 RepID=UPI000890784D|nr:MULTISPECIES: DEAD/DEAH box helicase [unclassified Microbacterium]SDO39634.1 Superfamily II DNA and RNA helicase [Microbacterium sp. ru370.1]SIT79434.1 Superfamily II DNA and RNA helicase [Microbacterium sp. RU1D]